MSVMQTAIETQLMQHFAAEVLQVINESRQHAVPPGSETHFKVIMVSAAFIDVSVVKRHQAVYAALAQHWSDGLHALALHTYTPDEWQLSMQSVPASPQCLGGQGR